MLTPGLLVAAQDEENGGKSWFRAMVVELPNGEDPVDHSSYWFRRCTKKDLVKAKRRRRRYEPTSVNPESGEDLGEAMLKQKEGVFKLGKVFTLYCKLQLFDKLHRSTRSGYTSSTSDTANDYFTRASDFFTSRFWRYILLLADLTIFKKINIIATHLSCVGSSY